MNKNTVIGFVLIGVILIGFSWYNTKVFNEQQRAQFVADSIAQAEALKNAPKIDSAAIQALPDSLLAVSQQTASEVYNAPVYADSLLETASKAEEQYYTLENDKLKIVFTTKGAQPSQVQVKDYYTHDSLDLNLVKKGASNFALSFYTDQQISTDDFVFTKVASTDTSLVMRLNFGGNAYMDYIYTLPAGSYLVKFDVNMVGMNRYISRNLSQIGVDWDLVIPRLEKGYDNEKNYSTIVYKYPNESDVEDLGLRKEASSEELTTKVEWFAFQQQFFSSILVAQNDFTGGNLAYKFNTQDGYYATGELMECSASMQVEYDAAESVTIPFEFYFGPNHYKTLKSYDYGFEKIVPLGGWLIGWINRVIIINCFDFLSKFISNYGLIILLLTIFIKIIIFPLTYKSYVSSAKMRVLKPEIEKINAKYPRKEDAMKKQQETMALYSKTGVSMFGGCLPMLLQFPILFAMFRFFPASFELRQEGFLWAKDLSGYDSILDLPFNIPLYGDHVSLFALLMGISMFFYSKMNMDQMPQDPNMAVMRGMQLYFMPIFMVVLCNNFSSGLSYYYMLSNIITLLQTWVIRKFFVDEKKIYAQLQAKASSAKAKPKSKWQMRLEEMQRQQAELQRQQQAKRREMDRRMQNKK
ncbi:MAG: membrane protein insertase YidC [Bacteroidales bacterium]|nr:membrane protein insertase YidC [Bacteroidales bacterium]